MWIIISQLYLSDEVRYGSNNGHEKDFIGTWTTYKKLNNN
jgi:hypothetical protein